jgi:hypothetical protein
MRRLAVLCAAFTALPLSLAAAEPAESTPSVTARQDEKLAVGIAVNPPVRWGDADSVGVSGYIGFKEHHAIRMNYATWKNHGDWAGTLIGDAFFDGDGSDAELSGRTTDIGIGYQYFPRGILDGLSLEAGVLHRSIDTRVVDEFASIEDKATNAGAFAGRALVGWSWLWQKRLSFGFAVGASYGRYAGTETTSNYVLMSPASYHTESFVRYEAHAEGYLRLGFVFGL